MSNLQERANTIATNLSNVLEPTKEDTVVELANDYMSVLDNYVPYTEVEGTDLNIDDASDLRVRSVVVEGNINQDGTPTLDEPVDIEIVTGNVAVNFEDSEGNITNYPLSLGDIEIAGNDDYGRDYIYLNEDDNKWYKSNVFNKYIFNGTENWHYNAERLGYTIETPILLSDYTYYAYCTHMQCSNSSTTWIADNYCGFNSNGVFWFKTSEFTTVTELKNWIIEQQKNGNQMVLYYKTSNPTDTEITDETLISQLNALYKARTYKNVTNINTSSDVLQPIVKLNYYQDYTKLIN